MSTSRARGPYAKGAERREQIIQRATDVFATEGFEGTALKRVAELVGVKEATLFHYFSGKQELLTAVLAERDRRAVSEAPGAEVGLASLVKIAERNRSEPGLTTLYAVASATANHTEHGSHAYFRDRYATVVASLAADIERRQASGEVRSDAPAQELAELVVAVSDGLQLQWLYNKEVDVAAGLARFIDTLLKAPASQGSLPA